MNSRLLSSGFAALSFTLSASVLGLALAPAMAHAANVDPMEVTVIAERQVATKRVATADLDLTSAADLKRLDSRILGAIGQVCREDNDGRTTNAERICRYDARVSADRQVAALKSGAVALADASGGDSSSSDIVVAAR